MSNTATLTEAEVKQVVEEWYRALDVHAPVERLLPLLADAELEMRFPEATLHGQAQFTDWYHGVIRKFFDETHTMKVLKIEPSGDQATVTLVVNWQCKMWDPPAPKSVWLDFDARQRWIVKRSPSTQKAVIFTYIVDGLDPMPGSASL